jgi:hypothetical protein
MIRSQALLSMLLLISLTAAGAERYDKANWERLLLPVHPLRERAGAFGTSWVTEFSAFNAGAQPVEIFQTRCQQDCTCAITTICIPEKAVDPGSFFQGFSGSEDASSYPNPGAFLYVEKSRVDELALNLRLFDAGHPKVSFGTEIPVVREREIRMGKILLVNVPVESGYRQQLRIYGISSPSGGGDVRVRIYRQDEATPLVDRFLQIAPSENRAKLPDENAFPRFPGYAELLSLAATLPALEPTRVRVEIEALTPGLQFWAAHSVTSNETQEVTLITPQ